jgi:hypothetical protein
MAAPAAAAAVGERLEDLRAELLQLRVEARGLPEELAQELAQLAQRMHSDVRSCTLATEARLGGALAAARAEAARLQVRSAAGLCAETGAARRRARAGGAPTRAPPTDARARPPRPLHAHARAHAPPAPPTRRPC